MPVISTLDVHDVRAALKLTGEVAAAREDPRRWPKVLLEGACRLLDAQAAVLLEMAGLDEAPRVAAHWAAGQWSPKQRQHYLDHLGALPQQDPLVSRLLRYTCDTRRRTTTAARAELVPQEAWERSPAMAIRREMSDLDDCLASVTRLAWRGWAMTLLVYRRTGHENPFADREWTLLELLHGELTWLYDAEFQRRPAHLSMLPPRMAETLSHLAAGLDERQAAARMGVSPHTVHDYVKGLHNHFGVSKRTQLLERWTRLNSDHRAESAK